MLNRDTKTNGQCGRQGAGEEAHARAAEGNRAEGGKGEVGEMRIGEIVLRWTFTILAAFLAFVAVSFFTDRIHPQMALLSIVCALLAIAWRPS